MMGEKGEEAWEMRRPSTLQHRVWASYMGQ